MLQMYGKKAEEAEELKLDIEDLKTMYRQQVKGGICVTVCLQFDLSQIEELLSKRRYCQT